MWTLRESTPSGEPLLVVPARRRIVVGVRTLAGAVALFGLAILTMSVLMVASIVPPPEGATPGQAVAAGVFVFLVTLSALRGALSDMDLVVTDQGLSVRARNLSLTWDELSHLAWDGRTETLWAVRSDDRAWYRRKRIPVASASLYDVSRVELERLEAAHPSVEIRSGAG